MRMIGPIGVHARPGCWSGFWPCRSCGCCCAWCRPRRSGGGFPGVALLLGLKDDETESDKTPWWLLLLRMLAVAARDPRLRRAGAEPAGTASPAAGRFWC